MNEPIKVEKINDSQYRIEFSVPFKEVDKKFDDFFKIISKDAQVPGFRKGHVPIQRLKQIFADKARPAVAQSIIGEYLSKTIKDKSLNLVGQPEIEGFVPGQSKYPGEFGFDNSFLAKLTVSVLPTIDPVGYTGMDLPPFKLDLQSIAQKKLLELQMQFAERRQVTDRGAALGDAVVVDFVGMLNGMPFEGGSASGHQIKALGDGSLIAGLEAGIIDMKVGEKKNISVKFPEDYRAKTLAGVDAVFEVTMQGIVESKPAQVDNDLALMAGFVSVEDMQSNVEKYAADYKSAMERNEHDRLITDTLVGLNPFVAPPQLVKDEANRILTASKNKLQDLPEHAVTELNTIAERNVKRAILIDAIYEKEKSLEVTPEELGALLEKHAQANNMSRDDLVSKLYNSGQMDNFVGILKTSKVLDYILLNRKELNNGSK